jgi:hypothetical protein
VTKAKTWEDYPEPLVDSGSGCLRWQGPVDPAGYGRISAHGYAHRVAWEREHGPIPEGMQIDHVADRGCRWRDCVLVAHLEPVTQLENIRRGRSGRRMAERTHCPQNHPYTPENIHRIPSRPNARYCRTCREERRR